MANPLYKCPECGGVDLDIEVWAKLNAHTGNVGEVTDSLEINTVHCNKCDHEDSDSAFRTDEPWPDLVVSRDE